MTQTDETDKTNQTDRKDQIDRTDQTDERDQSVPNNQPAIPTTLNVQRPLVRLTNRGVSR